METLPGLPVGWGIKTLINGHERILHLTSDDDALTMVASATTGLALIKQDSPVLTALGNNGNYLFQTGDIQIGSLKAQNCAISVIPSFGRNGNYTHIGEPTDLIAGLIGTRLFDHFLITLDFSHKELRLDPLPPIPDSNPSDPDWLIADRVRPQELKRWSDSLVPRAFTIRAQVRGNLGSPAPGLFTIETFQSRSVVDTNIAAGRTSLKADPFFRIAENDDLPWRRIYSTGKLVVETPSFSIPFDTMGSVSESASGVTGILGPLALRKLTIHLDYRDNLLLIDPPEKQ